MATQVAFISAGCTHATYKIVLDILGISAVSFEAFLSTIQKMHPVVEGMVTEMCDREKVRMKAMNQTKLGSWSKAVTCADGTWHKRGFHSKNGTFTIRNYDTGALLYFTHLCQKGGDNIPCKKVCGCLTDSFCQRARNSFSNILSTSKSAAEFRARLRGLVHHVQDRHQWEEEQR